MKNCHLFEKQLTAYLHGELNVRDFQTLEKHLAECGACHAALETQRATLEMLGEALATAPAPERIGVPQPVPAPVWVKAKRPKDRCSAQIPLFGIRVTSIAISSVFFSFLLMLSGGLVIFSVVKKSDMKFCPPPFISRSKMQLKKPRLKVKQMAFPDHVRQQKPAPKVSRRVVSKSVQGMSDILLPATEGMEVGPAEGIGGFEMMADMSFFGGASTVKEDMENGVALEPAPQSLREESVDADGFAMRRSWASTPAIVAFNPYVLADKNAFSTFSIDVDTASYGMARQKLLERSLPEPETVRTEEFINSFDYDYAPPAGKQTFAVHSEMAPSPFRSGFDVLKIGVKGRRIGRDDHRGAVLTLVIDTSGSMSTPERLGLIKKSLALLLDQLSPTDEVAIVQFGNEARLVCEHTPVSEKEALLPAIQALQPGGPTQFDLGLQLGYQQATSGFRAGDSNRILILSDGVANLGELDPDALLEQVAEQRKKGIYLSVLGFGAGTYDDEMLEKLANRGDGQYVYIDTIGEARRLFVDQLAATLHVIASDVKIQVEFNPERVLRYRQLGYENRQLTKEQFRDDSVDAGEVGSGQSVTALYDVQLKRGGSAQEPIATVYVRYRRADTGDIEEVSSRVMDRVRTPHFEAADVRFQLSTCVAEFAEYLRRSPYAEATEMSDIYERMQPAVQTLDLDEQVQELRRLISIAESLER